MATTSRRGLRDRVMAMFLGRKQNKAVYSSCADILQEQGVNVRGYPVAGTSTTPSFTSGSLPSTSLAIGKHDSVTEKINLTASLQKSSSLGNLHLSVPKNTMCQPEMSCFRNNAQLEKHHLSQKHHFSQNHNLSQKQPFVDSKKTGIRCKARKTNTVISLPSIQSLKETSPINTLCSDEGDESTGLCDNSADDLLLGVKGCKMIMLMQCEQCTLLENEKEHTLALGRSHKESAWKTSSEHMVVESNTTAVTSTEKDANEAREVVKPKMANISTQVNFEVEAARIQAFDGCNILHIKGSFKEVIVNIGDESLSRKTSDDPTASSSIDSKCVARTHALVSIAEKNIYVNIMVTAAQIQSHFAKDIGCSNGMDKENNLSCECSVDSNLHGSKYRSHVLDDESKGNVQTFEQSGTESCVVENNSLLSSSATASCATKETDTSAIKDRCAVLTGILSLENAEMVEQVGNVGCAMEVNCVSPNLPPPLTVMSCAAETIDNLANEGGNDFMTETLEPGDIGCVCEAPKVETNVKILSTKSHPVEEVPRNMEDSMHQREDANFCSDEDVADSFDTLKADSFSNSYDGVDYLFHCSLSESVDSHLRSDTQNKLNIQIDDNIHQYRACRMQNNFRNDQYLSATNDEACAQRADTCTDNSMSSQACPDTCHYSAGPEGFCDSKSQDHSGSHDLQQGQGLDATDGDSVAVVCSQDSQAESDHITNNDNAETTAVSVKLVDTKDTCSSIADECGMVDVYELTQKINQETRKLNKLFTKYKSRVLKIERLQNYLEQLKREKDEMTRLLLGVDKETIALRHEAAEIRCTVTAVCDISVANIGKETEARRLEPACYRRYSNIRTPADASNALISVRNRIKALNDLEVLIFRKQLMLNHVLPSIHQDKTPPLKQVDQPVTKAPKCKKTEPSTCNLASRSNIVIEVVSEPDSWSEMITQTDSPVTVSTLLTTSNDGTGSAGHLPGADV